jgi:MFS family permease
MLGPLPSVIWPSQIEQIVGPEQKEKYNGFVPAFGAAISLVTTPIAGMLSDRSHARIGRRKVFLIAGSIIAIVFFLLCSTADQYDSIWVFVGFTMGLQFGANLGAGPYAGLIPDTVHPSQIGKASGYNGLAAAMGYLVGYLGAGFFSSASFWQVYSFLGGIFVVFSLVTILGQREFPNREAHEPLTVVSFAKSFYLDPVRYRSFYWVILTRLLEQMGYYTVLPFLQYFIQDVIFADEPAESTQHEFYSSLLLGVIVVVSIPASITAGSLSDTYGRKKMVMLSMSIMTLGVATMILICYVNSIFLMLGCAVFYGVGYGAFLAVDWALALDSLPEGADAAKDLGIWHMSFVLPQVIAPVIAGQILNALKHHSIQLAYTVVFSIACLWFLVGTLFVIPIRLRTRSTEPPLQEE